MMVETEVPVAMSVTEILWGRPARSWSQLGDPQSWTRVGICTVLCPTLGPALPLLPVPQLHDLHPLGSPGEDLLIAYPGKVYLKNQRKGSGMRRYIGFEALVYSGFY